MRSSAGDLVRLAIEQIGAGSTASMSKLHKEFVHVGNILMLAISQVDTIQYETHLLENIAVSHSHIMPMPP